MLLELTKNPAIDLTITLGVGWVCYWICAIAFNVVVDKISVRRKL